MTGKAEITLLFEDSKLEVKPHGLDRTQPMCVLSIPGKEKATERSTWAVTEVLVKLPMKPHHSGVYGFQKGCSKKTAIKSF